VLTGYRRKLNPELPSGPMGCRVTTLSDLDGWLDMFLLLDVDVNVLAVVILLLLLWPFIEPFICFVPESMEVVVDPFSMFFLKKKKWNKTIF
jgi:hypothetical protein